MKPIELVGSKHASNEITQPGTGPRPEFLGPAAPHELGDSDAPDGVDERDSEDAEAESARVWDAEGPDTQESPDGDLAGSTDDELTPVSQTGDQHTESDEGLAADDERGPAPSTYDESVDSAAAFGAAGTVAAASSESHGLSRPVDRAAAETVGDVPFALIVMLIAAIGGATALVVLLLRHPVPQPPVVPSGSPDLSIAAARPVSATTTAAKAAVATSNPAVAAPAQAAEHQAVPAEKAAKPQPSEATAEAETAPKGAPPSAREVAHMAKIRATFEHNKAAAYRLIYSTPRAWRSSSLAEEREGLAAIALFSLSSRARARASATRFVARHPQSPLRARLEQLLESRK